MPVSAAWTSPYCTVHQFDFLHACALRVSLRAACWLVRAQAGVESLPLKVSCISVLWPKSASRDEAERKMEGVVKDKESMCPRYLRFARTPTNISDVTDKASEVSMHGVGAARHGLLQSKARGKRIWAGHAAAFEGLDYLLWCVCVCLVS